MITRKIELLIEGSPEKWDSDWNYLRQLDRDIYRAANLIVSNKYFDEAFAQRILISDLDLAKKYNKCQEEIKKLSDEIKNEKSKTKKEKLKKKRKVLYKIANNLTKDARQKAREFYLRSENTEIYHLINETFPHFPSFVTSSLVQIIAKDFVNDLFEVQRGERSVRSYKNGMPIPFSKSCLRFENKGENTYLSWANGIRFRLRFGRDKSNNRIIVDRIINGEYQHHDSKIQIKNNKIFLLLNATIQNTNKIKLDKNISVGVDLGLNIPMVLALSNSGVRKFLGNKDEFLRIRLQMQSRRMNLQYNLVLKKGGKGRKKKLKALNAFKDKESNFVTTYNHSLSAQAVKFAKDNRAGVIKLEFLEGYGDEEKNKFVLRNWSYYQLQQFIIYKAKQEGIEVKFVDPYHTSQTCSCCGHYEEGQRISQSEFLCKNTNCTNKDKGGKNKTENADYNAAKNISKSEKHVENKEDCVYYKIQQEINLK